ncbi:pyridoxamine 5'-phosphate oxidase [Antarcticibacterium flavum]|uniref:Pyridoxine/pyridoxamine 5'-phosphate oxidase n=1 Tax=Antarcticibacterium flavum TaxID=2058175 RepID=A0A5B7WYT0_9FLAO|nr:MULTISPECIES: pyridoxamine 5'-phosphate oxidase [Antarcticibacterium]MCM4159036.1 pyridoxamine 5'-phosphate oxidase [Antarcticibacterium sp. W02-3]QCY68279.1 pyridoxamine 5'-phosphate oxidase [Antarcticibacterium flavum]
MSKNLANYRRVYSKGKLLETEIPSNPMELFKDWFEEVEEGRDPMEVNAMTISTIGKDGYPKNRVVLLKEFTTEGFIFYTNYASDKGQALSHNPHICISFFWPQMERQVIIKGKAEKYSEEKAIEYFNSRPRGSQLGAWASNQSSEIKSREVLENRLKELEEEYEGKEVPKPDSWGGYLVRPIDFEFWQGRPNRLHDRIYFEVKDNHWKFKRLAP